MLFERLIMRVLMRMRRSGSGLSRMAVPMAPIRSMVVSAMMPAAWTTWSRAVCRAVVKLARCGSVERGRAAGGS